LVQIAKKLSLAHRSRIDIIANILRAAEKGTRKTHIMYKCNLSYRQLHTYLEFLIERRLMRYARATAEENSSGTYETTNKGRAFIQAYSSIRALISNTALEPSE
jgi:predicted transcriptional regulator